MVDKSLTTGANVNLLKSIVVYAVIFVVLGSETSAEKPPTETNAAIVRSPESTNSIGMKFKLIPAGTFMMGDATGNRDETPHEVTLSKHFKMGVHEVTQGQYKQVMGVNPSHFKAANNPVEHVSWSKAVDFCRKLSALPAEKAAGNVYCLPTEAEWEYACRAGTKTTYSFGNDDADLNDYARVNGGSPCPVGRKLPNAWGLYDMHGNVWEWCQDWYETHRDSYATDPNGPSLGSHRVVRGGGWVGRDGYWRSAFRLSRLPSGAGSNLGFRVCLRPSGQNFPESTNAIGMKFKLLPAGTFTMGEGDKAHGVTLTKPFQIGIHEVTQAQFKQVMGSNPSKSKGAASPVELVSWDDAVEFCRRLSDLPTEKAAGRVYRLPTEAQWEYACRAGTTTKYSFGDDNSWLGHYAWTPQNAGDQTHLVGSKQPNPWGLYDMHGNVWEWCQDRHGDYPSGSQTDPTGATFGSERVIRGGSWDAPTAYYRSAFRYGFNPAYHNYSIGFRVCLDPSVK